MASLTETAYYTRRAINWGILAIVLYIILRIAWAIGVQVWLTLFPPKPPPPTHAFGKLPQLDFVSFVDENSRDISFVLETITGGLPLLPNVERVYFMPKKAPNLLGITQAQDFVKKLKFDPEPFQETRTIYRFQDPELVLRTIRYDIVSENFLLRYNYEQDISVFTEGIINNPSAIKEEARELIQTLGLYQEDFISGEQKVTYFKLVGNILVPIKTIAETNAMRVDFFRGPVDKLPVVTESPTEGQIQVLFSPSKNPSKRVLELTYTYWPIDYNTFATYSLRPVGQAWQELQNGQGYIAKYPVNGAKEAVVRNVYLAYYDSFDPQTYLQPVYVFEGDFEFRAYVPAVAPEWIE